MVKISFLILFYFDFPFISSSLLIERSNQNKSDMAVIKFDEVPYEQVKEGLQRKIIYTKELMTVLIDFSNGPWEAPDPPHSHPHQQTSYVAEGEIIFYCEGEPDQHLKAGDMYAIPSGLKHSVKLLTKNVRLIDSFYPVREDFLKKN
jgi:quercetin dioxygenase-like cupin family protein